ncbi:small heat shock protein [Hysterangium stoloniferum]|nr:small heat shock protein [Hysterangium stoloniferum]
MSLSNFHYDPFYEPFYTVSDFNRLLNNAGPYQSTNRDLFRNDEYAGTQGVIRPRMNLHGDYVTGEMTATFELPGLRREDVNVDVINNRLVVSGSAEGVVEVDEAGYAVRERTYGRFSRTVPLPAGTKPSEIDARVADGILTVRFPQQQATEERIIVS